MWLILFSTALGPVYTNPVSNENGAVLLRIRISFTLQRRKRAPKTEPFENDAFWKHYFLVWTEKTMLSENGDVVKIDTTGRQTARSWVSKMADRGCRVTPISPIYWNATRRVHLSMRTEGIKRFQNGYGVVVWAGKSDMKTISVDANLFENEAK